MRERSSTGGKPLKAGRKATAPKRPNAPRAARAHKSPAGGEETEVARLRRELNEALEQQAATAEVLRTIASAPAEAERALDTIAKVAARLFGASDVNIMRLEGGVLRHVATLGELASAVETAFPDRPLDPSSMPATAILERRPLHIADLSAPDVRARFPTARLPKKPGSVVAAPLMREGEAIGAIVLVRDAVRPFTEMELAQVQNFADQAVIAIENTRLLNDLRESLEQQTATTEVLRVISSSAGDLEPVFRTLLASATRICEATFGSMLLRDGNMFRRVALHNAPPKYLEFHANAPVIDPQRIGELKRIIETRQAIQVPDAFAADPNNPIAKYGGARTLLAVPMLKDSDFIGAIAIFRQEVRPFTEKQIELVQNFAAQAVIAIENTRLLNELRQRTEDLSQSLEDLRTAQDRLVQTEKLASLGQLTAGIAHEIKNPLNFVNNFSAVSVELIEELRQALALASLDGRLHAEIGEIADMLQGNLDKVVQHGRRADSIVKNMLQHSRQGSAEHRPVDINALVEESLNLAYHGARAEQQGFNITLERSLDPAAGEADVFPQDVTRVLLNLISNGFYAATRRKAQADGGDYEPTLAASTRNLGDRVEIKIRDNGTGIPPEVKEQMFSPFFTTKPAGEGTGLGLSISHDVIVKQHGGSIEVDTQPGAFTEIKITLPRSGAFPGEPPAHA